MSDIPIHGVLPDLLAALREQTGAVLIAPPGAGKTTAVAPALLGEPWCSGTVVVLSPRRVAARAAAERMSELLGEPVGTTVGYATRLDSKRSHATRVVVMTEAIFVAAILADPELAGISAILFDEAHERHLDSDLALALAAETRAVLRPDLRLLVMSATIDGARFAALLGAAPVIESAGVAWPLDVRWLGARPELRIEDAVAAAVKTAWRETTGDILAFLPGVREIERCAERLREQLPEAPILPLHGQVDPAAQRSAIRRDAQGRRRIVLASAIAETSLTLDGVSVVVDSGLSRRAEFDKAAGVTRLVTHTASQAASAQRAGRAARQGPGTAYRLWEAAAHPGRARFDPPEMLTADLTPLTLKLAQWGAGDPGAMAWLDPPPAAALAAARARLVALGALDEAGRITPHGRALAAVPLDPPLAHMLVWAGRRGTGEIAGKLALLLQERGLGGRGEDLAARLARWESDRSARAEASRKLAARWVRAGAGQGPERERGEQPPLGIILAQAFPDNLARRRDGGGEDWICAGGRGLRLDPASPLARAEWLAVGDAQGEAKGARITAAAALSLAEVEAWLAERITAAPVLRWIAEERRVEALLERRLGAILVSRGPDPAPDTAALEAFLIDRVERGGLDLLPFSQASRALLVRCEYAGVAALAPPTLIADLADWVGPLLRGQRRLDAIAPTALHDALLARLDYAARRDLDARAPASFVSPVGSQHPIDFGDPAGPSVEVRVQALFGLDTHPLIGRPPRPLLLKLTSPAGRPLQVTQDLPGFWRGTWRDVQREMKGRYPRHRWPDAPWAEDPSLKTRNAFDRQRGA